MNQVCIYYDLNALRFKGEYVALEEDKHIPSLAWLQSTLVLKPQHAYTCLGRIRIRAAGRQYQIEEISSGFFSQRICGHSKRITESPDSYHEWY